MRLALRLLGTNAYTKYVVISQARTGSNLLYSYLNSHPQIEMDGEIFRYVNEKSIRRIYQEHFSKKAGNIKAAGCKLFYFHPEDGSHEELLSFIEAIPGIHVVHLTRNDKLEMLASWKIAIATNVWGIKEGTPLIESEKKKVTIQPEEALRYYTETTSHERRIHERFKNGPYLAVVYEDLVREPQRTLAVIQTFLGVPVRALTTSFIRSNPEPPEVLIENYAELEALGIPKALRKTRLI